MMLKLFILLNLILISLVNVQLVEAKIRRYKWEVKYEYKSPDCFRKLVITVNGRTPGPTILAKENDTIVVELKNSLLTENVAIHWHGIRQGNPLGLMGQRGFIFCSLEHICTMLITGMQREAGLYGSIRVAPEKPEPFSYDYDRSIILNDWYHKSTHEQATGLSSIPFQWVEEPQSLLIQGKGKFNCSQLTAPSLNVSSFCDASNPECSPYVLTVVPGKTFRLRISSLTALSALSFQIEGHNMTVVEADGHLCRAICVNRPPKTPPGLAILNYYPNNPKRLPPTAPPPGPYWDDVQPRVNQSLAIKAHQNFTTPPPPISDRLILFLNTQNLVNGYRRWSAFDQTPPPNGFNLTSYDIYNIPENRNGTASSAIYRLSFNSTVDIVLQNAKYNENGSTSETHPWHLHGHDFWVLGYGEGKFDMYKDPRKYNLLNPIMKNTVPVHPYGWTALRFQADNPGAWAFHCHIESHFFMGMGVVFAEGIERLGKLPSSIMGCAGH
ncbi:hypothetical protein Patl1_27329 [Pistacia atlantica]|uniref:Uncharacterized protein n=1 Tax=Pistacia atlantica TaxID=434234 RepID=A0ACC1BE10_9ROSI|nr:hypothetical protein Patl1_27329 [Pistacia atlantica]